MDFADGNLTDLESMGIVKLLNFLANFIHLSFIHREVKFEYMKDDFRKETFRNFPER